MPVRDGQAFVLRDRTIPLLRLSELLGRAPAPAPPVARVVLVGGWRSACRHRSGRFWRQAGRSTTAVAGLAIGYERHTRICLLGDGTVLLVLELSELLG